MTDGAGTELEIPDDLSYSRDHLWARRAGDSATIGVTAFACDQLGEVVYLELPEPGTDLHEDEPFGVIESVKSVSDLYAPVSGAVIERNDAVVAAPEVVNESPYGHGWLLRISVAQASEFEELLTPQQYREMYQGE